MFKDERLGFGIGRPAHGIGAPDEIRNRPCPHERNVATVESVALHQNVAVVALFLGANVLYTLIPLF